MVTLYPRAKIGVVRLLDLILDFFINEDASYS